MKELEKLVKDLEQKSCEMEDNFFKKDADLEAFKMNIQMNMRGVAGLSDRMDDHEQRITDLENEFKNKLLLLKGGEGSGGVDVDALSDLLNNLRNEFDEKFATKDAMDDLTSRVVKLEEDYGQLADTSEQHTTDIEELKNKKVDKDVFDAEISFIKNVLNSKGGEKIEMPPSSGEVSPELLARVKELEKDVNHIKDELKNVNLGQLSDMIKALEAKLDEKAD